MKILKVPFKLLLSIITPFVILFIFVLNFNTSLSFSVLNSNTTNNNILNNQCYCVIFRMDDIQDYGFLQGQIAPMDLFISKNLSMSLGLIMHVIGNNSNIINKVKEGQEKKLFELALHGWDHIDYSKLSEQQQQYFLQKANEKMKQIFGNTTNIFFPPLDPYNNDTIKVLDRLNFSIISSLGYEENILNHGKNIFNTKGKFNNNNLQEKTIFHIPGTITFKSYVNGTWVSIPMDKIMTVLSANIKKYGYGVVVMHPQDFLISDKNGKFTNVVNNTEISNLSHLINSIQSKNEHIVTFSQLINNATTINSK